MTAAVFAIEPFKGLIDEVKPLVERHWKELALYQDDVLLDPDYATYEAANEAGMSLAFTARIDGELIGYALYWVRPHMHYKTTLCAVSDLFWIAPEHRNFGVGSGMFAFIEDELKRRGVKIVHTTFKTAHPAAGKLLEMRGHTLVEYAYSKKLD